MFIYLYRISCIQPQRNIWMRKLFLKVIIEEDQFLEIVMGRLQVTQSDPSKRENALIICVGSFQRT